MSDKTRGCVFFFVGCTGSSTSNATTPCPITSLPVTNATSSYPVTSLLNGHPMPSNSRLAQHVALEWLLDLVHRRVFVVLAELNHLAGYKRLDAGQRDLLDLVAVLLVGHQRLYQLLLLCEFLRDTKRGLDFLGRLVSDCSLQAGC
ncbi:hypothetical protein PC116_g4030 [Phytophthora cactorum]|nr:hypothetical protein Pcac1_g12249 [Phytophthora cactorum]KAG2794358.1 hypothetical protein PC112_g23074 [Phytophthora cactorum]KAG2821122.1 hypothetical protein PC111_g11171 [Phytophthora cactorum]KAG3024824.1 hypothetical protein PC120_g6839 [Phytophthora cactorum]KAG3071940.1 hypothetical protein PC122_g15450 [Phytophthora cactorum]